MTRPVENSEPMPAEPLSPELALVDPELGARARALLPYPAAQARSRATAAAAAVAPEAAPASPEAARARYPIWARLAATLWILVVGILIGGTAIPHAKDKPVLIPRADDIAFCEKPRPSPAVPTRPLQFPRGDGSP
jgi:hypothetical protein